MKRRSISLFALSAAFAAAAFISAGNAASINASLVNPREEATVSIAFDGLMALCFGNPERASAGILDVHHHTPEMSIVQVKKGKKTKLAELKGEEMRGTFHVVVEGSASIVSRYYSEAKDENDFRWTVDLEGDLHQKQLYIKEEKLFGKIHFSSGLFFGSNLSEERFRFFSADNSGKALSFDRRIAEPAAKINLNRGETLVIATGRKILRLTAEPGIRYEISITNLPPADMASMDHWLYYYDFVGADVERYVPVAVKKAALAPPPLMCGPAIFSKSKLD